MATGLPAPPSPLNEASSTTPHQPNRPRGELTCRICGSTPAIDATFHRIKGFIIMMKTGTFIGPFCHDCGTAVFREAQSGTIRSGWWGAFSFFGSLFVIPRNLFVYRGIRSLAPPVPPQPSVRSSLPMGKPVLRRPEIVLLVLGPLVAGALIVAFFAPSIFPSFGGTSPGGGGSSAQVSIGTCGSTDRPGQIGYPVPCDDPSATRIIVGILPAGSSPEGCPQEAMSASESPTFGVICWKPQ
jgi:hypothetical protein